MLKNKFVYIVVLVTLFMLISTGCSNKTDRQLNQMYDQANVLLEEGNRFEQIDTSKGTEISQFVKSVKDHQMPSKYDS